MDSALFHPPASYVAEGGAEDVYIQEMKELIRGVPLENREDAEEQLREPDGNFAYNNEVN